MNLKTKLEALMGERGLTRANLSKATGLPYTTIDSILKRETFDKVKLSTLQILKDYFDVSLDYLMIDSLEDKNYGKPQIAITYREQQIILAYRDNPDMQAAVDRLLYIEAAKEDTVRVFRAAQSKEHTEGGVVDMPRSALDKLKTAKAVRSDDEI